MPNGSPHTQSRSTFLDAVVGDPSATRGAAERVEVVKVVVCGAASAWSVLCGPLIQPAVVATRAIDGKCLEKFAVFALFVELMQIGHANRPPYQKR